ncbi:MAG: PorP/SprF family type IX secretion system membrane protein [Flavobacteriales bacterium]|nr:PorP/SprF family type IX secretion system membrane protein [Flavobacteriales bacterium]
MRKLIVIAFLLGMVSIKYAQDPNFSQFFMNSIYYNPGLTGINDGVRFGSSYRNLWQPIPSKFNSGTVSIDGAGINKMGLGLLASYDIEGEGKLRTTALSGNYSYRVVESRNIRFQLGINGQYIRKQVDWTQLVFSDQLDEVFGNVYSSSFIIPSMNVTQYVDFGAGGALSFNAGLGEGRNGKNMTGTVGLAVHHLAQPTDAFIGGGGGYLPRKLVVHGELKIVAPSFLYAPALIYEHQSNMSTFQAGLNFSKVNMFAGIWFRNQTFAFSPQKYDSFIFNIGITRKAEKGNSKLRMGYSYDFTVSRLKTSSFGTHELALTYEWGDKVLFKGLAGRKAQKAKYRFIPCTDY